MWREISTDEIAKVVEQMYIDANYRLPPFVKQRQEEALAQETNELGCYIFRQMQRNAEIAEQGTAPICQDTGMAVIFAEIGQDVHVTGGLFEDAVNLGVSNACKNGYLRASVVSDPLQRVNTTDNTPAVIHTRLVAGNKIHITAMPKGFGSENMSALRMFTPASNRDEVIDYVVETVRKAGSNPCPPVVVGVGLGGTADKACEIAKTALYRETAHPDPFYAQMEETILARVNALGIGPQGLGGSQTALSVRINTYATHIAGLPCAVNIGCHVTRYAHAEI